jgi:hypothetical protein
VAEPPKHRWRPVSPLLYRGVFGHDRQWEHDVVEAIRLGRPAPAAFSLGGADPWLGEGRLHTGEAYVTAEGAIARDLAEEKAARALTKVAIEANREKVAKAKAKARAEREALDAAMEAERQAYEAKARALRESRVEEDAEWSAADQRRRETQAIMKNKWQCIRCKNIAVITPDRDGYTLRCICGKKGWADHATFVRMIAA